MANTLGEQIPDIEALLNFCREHPDLHAVDIQIDYWCFYDTKEAFSEFLRQIGSFRKIYQDIYFSARKSFSDDGRIRIDFFTSRDMVCERVVVGTKEVPEQYTPAHTEEIVEWKCSESLLEHSAKS